MSNEYNKAPAVPQVFTAEENPVMALSDCINVLESTQLLNDSVRVWACVQNAKAAMKSLSAQSQPAVPQGTNWHAYHVIVCKGALQMVRNALRNDAERGLVVRGEMLEELDKVTYPVAPASQAHTSWTTIFEAGRHYWLIMRDGTISHGAYEQLAQVFWTNKGVVSKENVLFVQPFIPPACPLIDTTDTALQSVLLTDLVKVLEDLQSAFMSHTRWSGPPPAEIVAARAILSAISRKTPT